MTVGYDLNFYVAWFLDELFRKHPIITEARTRFIRGPFKAIPTLRVITCHTHTLATTTGGCFEHYRVSKLVGDLHGMFAIAQHIGKAGDGIHTCIFGQLLGGNLVTHGLDGVGLGTDKSDPFLGQ